LFFFGIWGAANHVPEQGFGRFSTIVRFGKLRNERALVIGQQVFHDPVRVAEEQSFLHADLEIIDRLVKQARQTARCVRSRFDPLGALCGCLRGSKLLWRRRPKPQDRGILVR
jgi:hypothetical protein